MTQGTTKGVPIDTDPTMALNSNQVVPSQAAVVTYVGAQVATKLPIASGVSVGKILRSDGTNWVATTSTYPAASVGSGKILYDNGTNFVTSTPTFPASASATSRQMIVSDGTNWVASTETWAVPGTIGNILTSDGTNWTSAPPAGAGLGLNAVRVQLTSAQIKTLHATPVQIVAAPGVGKAIIIVSYSGIFNYGGSNVFVAGASQVINLAYGTTALGTLPAFINNGTLVSSSSRINGFANNNSAGGFDATVFSNTALNAYNNSATEISGNAAGNNTIDCILTYCIVTI